MSTHLADEQIIDHLDGTLPVGDEQFAKSHLADCDDCRSRLAQVARFDTFVQSHLPVDAVLVAAMFSVSERVLAQRAAPATSRRGPGWRGIATRLAAVLLLSMGVLWMLAGHDASLGLRITRYVPADNLRAAPPERFHLDLRLEQPGFVAVFARFADDRVEQLPPGLMPGTAAHVPLAPGAVRLPANELLDWEYPADQMPRAVLVVVFAAEPDAGACEELRSAWAEPGSAALDKLLARPGRKAQRLPFPR